MSTMTITVADLPALVAYVAKHQKWSDHYATTVNCAVKACTIHLDPNLIVDPNDPLMRDAPYQMALNKPHLAATTLEHYERNWLQLMSVLAGETKIPRSRKGFAWRDTHAAKTAAPAAVIEPAVVAKPTPVVSQPPANGLRMSVIVTDDKVTITTQSRHIEVTDLDPDTIKAAVQALMLAVLALES